MVRMSPSTIASLARCGSRTDSCAQFPSITRARSSCSSPARQSPVELNVHSSLPRPGEILAHAVRHQRPPVIGLPVELEGARERPRKCRSGEVIEHDTRAAPGSTVIVLHRIGEPAGAPHERHRTVAQRIHLIETAGFVQGGHKEHIARRLYPMGELVAVTAMEEDPAGEALLQGCKELLIARLTAA